jgi:hypothetical protein
VWSSGVGLWCRACGSEGLRVPSASLAEKVLRIPVTLPWGHPHQGFGDCEGPFLKSHS